MAEQHPFKLRVVSSILTWSPNYAPVAQLAEVLRLERRGCEFDPVHLHQIYSSIAQLVEHLTVNQVVPGSRPGRGAKLCISRIVALFLASIQKKWVRFPSDAHSHWGLT